MEAVTFQGDAFSEYYVRELLLDDPVLSPRLNADGAQDAYRDAARLLRKARRELRDRVRAASTASQLLEPLAGLLGWKLGDGGRIATDEGEEEGGFALLAPEDDRVLARVVCLAPGALPDAAPSGRHRRFAPPLALARVLLERGETYGLLLTASELRLVCVAGSLPSMIGFDLAETAEGTVSGQEAWTLLYGLLRQDVLASRPPLLDHVREYGKNHQQRVSSELGTQVQQAVQRLLQGVLRHPENTDRLPAEITDEYLKKLYQAALRVLYRLLFVLYAEDRRLLPVDLRTYQQGYSLNRLIGLARTEDGRGLADEEPSGSFLQDSLMGLFRLLREGVDLGPPEGAIEGYGGGLFESSRTELLDNLRWGNEAVAGVLRDLTRVRTDRGGYARVSYRELDVEQLGSIYEGLLELTPAYASLQMWRVRLDDQILIIDDAMRQRLAVSRGEVLTDSAFRVDRSVTEAPDSEPEEDDEEELPLEEDESEEDEEEEKPARTAGRPLRVDRDPLTVGTVYLRGGLGRKQSGAYYTNRVFVDFLVRKAVDPRADEKSPEEILNLRCCDMAMGSAHFLVGVCRRLAEHLLAAYRREYSRLRGEPGNEELTDDDFLLLAGVPEELRRVWGGPDQEAELAACRLMIAGNCLYGVDKNPLAVDLAKVSIWLATAAARQPLTFLDHRFRVGDALLGLTAEEVVSPYYSGKPSGKTWADYPTLLTDRKQVEDNLWTQHRDKLCLMLRKAFELLKTLRLTTQHRRDDFRAQQLAHAALERHLEPLTRLHCLRVGLAFSPVRNNLKALELPGDWLDALLTSDMRSVPAELRERGKPYEELGRQLEAFCWEFAFPEAFYLPNGQRRPDAGFDVLVGNPPWDKIKPSEKEFFSQYDPTIIGYQGQARKALVREIRGRVKESGPCWEEYQRSVNLYKQKLLKEGLYTAQQDTVPNEKTGGQKTTGGDPDLFKFFTERFFRIAARETGRIAILIPSGLYAVEGTKGLRRLLLDEGQIEHLYSYENRRGIFDALHRQFKFCTLVVAKKAGANAPFPCAFMLQDPAWLQATPQQQAGRLVQLSPKFIEQQSPTHLSFFEFRSAQEMALVQRIYKDYPTLGKQVEGAWNVAFSREMDMTNDSYLFRDRERLRTFGGVQHRGEYWTLPAKEWFDARPDRFVWVRRTESQLRGKPASEAAGARRSRKAAEATFEGYVLTEEQHELSPQIMVPDVRYVPLYEGRMVQQFDHAAKAYVSGSGRGQVWRDLGWTEKELVPHYFVAVPHTTQLLAAHRFDRGGFCDVTGQTNERSALCALIPGDCPAGNKVPTASFMPNDRGVHLVWLWLANSFVVDWLLRLRISTSINFFYWYQTAMPRLMPTDYTVQTEFVEALSRLEGQTAAERARLRTQLDVEAALAYRLSAHEFAALLASFPLLDRDQPWLPREGFIAFDRQGRPRLRPRSFLTRDKLLLEYFRRVGRKPPTDIVRFFAEVGVDIDGGRMLAGEPPVDPFNPPVFATGPIRDLEERVRIAEQVLGAIAYVPTTRKRPTDEALMKVGKLEERFRATALESGE